MIELLHARDANIAITLGRRIVVGLSGASISSDASSRMSVVKTRSYSEYLKNSQQS